MSVRRDSRTTREHGSPFRPDHGRYGRRFRRDRPRRADRWSVRWVLLYGDRRALALVTVLVILAALLTVGSLWEFEMDRLVTET